MKLKVLWGALVSLALIRCTVGGGQAYQVRTLSSGKPLRVLSVGTMYFPDGPALMLKYQTDIKIDDVVALRKEADDVWKDFKSDVERANFKSAILSASTTRQGFIITSGQSYNFAFVRQPNGEWVCTNDK